MIFVVYLASQKFSRGHMTDVLKKDEKLKLKNSLKKTKEEGDAAIGVALSGSNPV